jgi:hypothetical protein
MGGSAARRHGVAGGEQARSTQEASRGRGRGGVRDAGGGEEGGGGEAWEGSCDRSNAQPVAQ